MNLNEVIKYYKLAAENGDVIGQFNLGASCYAGGDALLFDKCEAFKWYKRAAETGYPKAQHSLGDCYMNGTGVTVDKLAAVELYKRAAKAGGGCRLAGSAR